MHHYSFSLDFLPDAHRFHSQGIFCFFEGNTLVEVDSHSGVLSQVGDLRSLGSSLVQSPLYIGGYGEKLYFAQELEPGTAEARGYSTKSMRQLGLEDELLFAMFSRGLQLLNWRRNHQYCGRCGSEALVSNTEYAMRCAKCELSFYPKIMPCVMALVTKGDQLLLARHARRGTSIYTALAGFIEAGETVEHAIKREVLEEVGVTTGDIKYFSSQAWPFPGQLMLGFYAEYLEGDIQPEEGEIEDAKWFSADALPEIPAPFTLSGQLIRSFVENKN